MPEFLQSSFLAGLAALSVPLLIHLFFRLRTKRVELGTIRFLRIVLEENARRRKVMRWFLLALRLACVLLLVGLFARPYFSQASVANDQELLVLLIDRSATMNLKGERGRLVDQAFSEAREVLDQAPAGTRVEVALFDHAVQPLTSDKGKHSSAATATEALQSGATTAQLFGGTSYGAAMDWARDVLLTAGTGPRQLHLFTDMQRSGLDWTDVGTFPAGVQVYLHNYARPVVNNVAVIDARPVRTWIRPGEGTTISATVMHGGAFALDDVPLVLEIGRMPDQATTRNGSEHGQSRFDFARLTSRIMQRERIKLEPGSSVTVSFELPPLSEGEWQGRVTIEYDDDLAFDNQRYLAISAAPAYRVLVVNCESKREPLLSETHFLEAALRLATPGESYAESPFAPDVIHLDRQSSLPPWQGAAAIVLANPGPLASEDAGQLAHFVQDGGGLLVFTGAQTTEEDTQSLRAAGLTAGRIGETRVARDLPWRIGEWDRRHSVFQPFNDPQYGDLRRLVFAAYTPIVPGPEARVLATFATGDPWMLEQPAGAGRVIWVTTSCGREWGNWTRTPLFLPLVHQLLGDELGLNAGGRVRSRLIAAERPAGGEIAPDKAESQDVTDVAASASRTPGVVRAERFVEVINSNARESETEACTVHDFEDRFGMEFMNSAGAQAQPVAAQADVEQDEWWHWVACALLGVLLLEGFVGNRTTA